MWGQKSGFADAIKQSLDPTTVVGVRSLFVNAAKRASQALGQLRSKAASVVNHAAATGDIPAATRVKPAFIIPQREDTRLPRIIIFLCVALLVAVATVVIDWVDEAYSTLSISDMLLSSVSLVLLLSVAFGLWRELRAWQSLAIVEQLQYDLSNVGERPDDKLRFHKAFAQLRARVREPQFVKFVGGVGSTADVATLREDLDRIGLHGMDAKAISAIHDSTRDIFYLSLLTGNQFAEVLVFAIRAFGLIRRVASAYGYRPGRLRLIRLTRRMFTDIALLDVSMLLVLDAGRGAGSGIRKLANAAGAGAATLVATHAPPLAPAVGTAVGLAGDAAASLVESVAPRIVDASIAAGRMAQLGLLAAAIVRPVAFSPSTSGVMRNTAYKQILGLRREATRSNTRQNDQSPDST